MLQDVDSVTNTHATSETATTLGAISKFRDSFQGPPFVNVILVMQPAVFSETGEKVIAMNIAVSTELLHATNQDPRLARQVAITLIARAMPQLINPVCQS